MNIYKKPMVELIEYGENDVVTASGLPDNVYQGGEVGDEWIWKGNGEA